MRHFLCPQQEQRDLEDGCEDEGREIEGDDKGFGCFFDYSDDEANKFVDEVDLVVGRDCLFEGVEDASEGRRRREGNYLLFFLEHPGKYLYLE